MSSALKVADLRKTFGEGEQAVTALDGVSLEIERGQVVGLLGPNGAGKTTMIKSILGLVTPDEGDVEVAGIDIQAHPSRAYAHIGAIFEGARNIYWQLTVRENLEFFAGLAGEETAAVRQRHDRLLELVGLEDKAETTVNRLSRGMKQKVSLVSTLARDVDVVFMDEPTLGLDVEASIELRSELRRLADNEDVTIVVTSHDMDVIEAVCDRVVILNHGSVIADDDVDSLLNLLNVKQYRVTLSDPLDEPLRTEIEREFDVTLLEEHGSFHIEVTVTDPNVVYELLSVLRREERELVDLQSIDPDLEEVFLSLIGDDTADSGPAAESTSTPDTTVTEVASHDD